MIYVTGCFAADITTELLFKPIVNGVCVKEIEEESEMMKNFSGLIGAYILFLYFSTCMSVDLEDIAQCNMEEVHGEIALNCQHQNLTYIPKVGENIRILEFGFNELTDITQDTFENVSNPDILVNLQLNDNKIRNISSNALDNFRNLEVLYLSNNPVYYDNLKQLLGAISRIQSLRELRMSGISTIRVNEDVFSLMNGNHIRSLGLETYNTKTVSFAIFSIFTRLETIHLRDNHIESLSLAKHDSLRSLYLLYNDLDSIPNFTIKGNSSNCYFPNLDTLDLRYNRINEIRKESFACLEKLQTLALAGNQMKLLPNDVLSRMPSLTLLNVKFLSGRNLHIAPYALRSKSLEILQLGFNADADAVFDSPADTFKHSVNLKHLTLSHIIMLKLPNSVLTKLFSPLTNLLKFKCYACKLSQDPKFVLNHMKSVENVDLLGNLITTVSTETCMYNKHLKTLSLRYNQLGHISESAFPVSLLNRLSSVDLSQNPFVCDCQLEWFIKWMNTAQGKTVLSRYPNEYVCSKPTGKHGLMLPDVYLSHEECHPWGPWMWVAVIASPCVVVIGIVAVILYRNWWNMKHYIFLLRKRRNYQRIPGNAKLYDAFVAYESTDSALVKQMETNLEDELGVKLCIHERDFYPGSFINDNIVKHMEASEKVIVVLSNEFAQSGWCMFELKIAHSKLIEDETELVVILLEKTDAKNMNDSLRVLFNTTTYIEWTRDDVGQQLFWAKLKAVLQK